MMIMTKKLADQLMETLMCVALSATGGVNPENINQNQMEYANEYANATFVNLLEEWEGLTGKKWGIEEN